LSAYTISSINRLTNQTGALQGQVSNLTNILGLKAKVIEENATMLLGYKEVFGRFFLANHNDIPYAGYLVISYANATLGATGNGTNPPYIHILPAWIHVVAQGGGITLITPSVQSSASYIFPVIPNQNYTVSYMNDNQTDILVAIDIVYVY
jgi:hypothetical protein